MRQNLLLRKPAEKRLDKHGNPISRFRKIQEDMNEAYTSQKSAPVVKSAPIGLFMAMERIDSFRHKDTEPNLKVMAFTLSAICFVIIVVFVFGVIWSN